MREGRGPGSRRIDIVSGLLAGVVSALLMTVFMLGLRAVFGVATPSELIGDRLAPALSVDTFLSLLNRAGGYNQLKQIGFVSVLAGQLIVGALGGIVYALLTHNGKSEFPTQPRWSVTTKGGRLFILLFIAGLWIVSVILLWPVLGTHYRGLPPGHATVVNILTLLSAYVLFGAALIVTRGAIVNPNVQGSLTPSFASSGRRALLVGGAGVLFALGISVLLRHLYKLATFSYDGTQYKGDVEFITPNDRFYVVTKNVIDPDINRDNWRLEITGMVERPQTYRFEELTGLPAVTQDTTLMCISNDVGGGLMSNATWKGLPLKTLLQAAGVRPGVREVLLHGVDNYSDSFPLEKALEETTLVVYEMNGEALTRNHGYPVRVVVPGLFGEKSVKWVTRIELMAQDAQGFYERQGWGPNFVIPTHSRFDAPDFSKPLPLGENISLKGVAFCGDRGVSRVEVSFDDGLGWREVNINTPGTRLTWALWNYDWRPDRPGEYKLAVRATDGDGTFQTAEQRGTVPQGATGYHRVSARVTA